jgi:hypothetical protein
MTTLTLSLRLMAALRAARPRPEDKHVTEVAR